MSTTHTLGQTLLQFSSDSPLLARLILASIEVALLAAAVYLLTRIPRLASPRFRAALWLLVLAKGVFSVGAGSPLPLYLLSLPEARSAEAATATAGAVDADQAARNRLEEERALAALAEAERMDASAAAAAPGDGTTAAQRAAAGRGSGDAASRPGIVARAAFGLAASVAFAFRASWRGFWSPAGARAVAGLWIVGVCLMLLLTLRDFVRIARLRRAATEPSPEILRHYLEQARLWLDKQSQAQPSGAGFPACAPRAADATGDGPKGLPTSGPFQASFPSGETATKAGWKACPTSLFASSWRRLCEWLSPRRPPRLLVSDAVSSPALVGVFRPVVLLPAWLVDSAPDPRGIAWLLRHELMHWRLRDTLGLAVRRAAEILLYFHPAVWWAGRRWEEAMELACDRALLRTDADARDYAEQLYGVLQAHAAAARPAPVRAGLCATRTQIGRRIAALLTNPLATPARLSPSSATLLVLLTVAALSCGVGVDQSEQAKAKAKKETDSGQVAVATPAPTSTDGVVYDPTNGTLSSNGVVWRFKQPGGLGRSPEPGPAPSSGNPSALPAESQSPPLPTLTTAPKWVEGQRILVSCWIPASAWKQIWNDDAWPYFVRIDGKDYHSSTSIGSFSNQPKHEIVDLTAGLIQPGSGKPVSLPAGKHRVALLLKNIDLNGPADPAKPIHFDELATPEAEFEVVHADSPEGQALRVGEKFEGKTQAEWIDECAAFAGMDKSAPEHAAMALASIGKPAVPALVELVESNDPRGYYAAVALGRMGEDAREALPRLLEIARQPEQKPKWTTSRPKGTRMLAFVALGKMAWAAAEVVPVLKHVAEDANEKDDWRQSAVAQLGELGAPALPALQVMMDGADPVLRGWASGALEKATVASGGVGAKAFYEQLIDKNPFDPNVPQYLTKTKEGAISNGYVGKSHPLSEKIKALYRERLKQTPDPQIAWGLASIIQSGLANTDLEWSVNGDSVYGHWTREDPAESYVSMAKELELGFAHSKAGTELRQKIGIGLAKTRLLQGDWDGMNAMLAKLGQQPIPAADRPWLHAPPKDWTNLRANWGHSDAAMRSGECALELHFEKDGRGLAGVHVLIKKMPKPNPSNRGWRTDTLFESAHPLATGPGWGVGDESFGYSPEGGRTATRYAVSDATGVVRFERLPEIVVTMEVLVPTGNFSEAGRDWEMALETSPGHLQRTAGTTDFGTKNPAIVWSHDPAAQLVLQPGQTVRYPKIVVRPTTPAAAPSSEQPAKTAWSDVTYEPTNGTTSGSGFKFNSSAPLPKFINDSPRPTSNALPVAARGVAYDPTNGTMSENGVKLRVGSQNE
jgi:hypothetical protein